MEWLAPQVGIPIALIAFAAEFVDSSLGMGYGTALTPILLLMGFPVEQVVPAVLMSEFVTGLLAGVAHHRVGNADLAPRILSLRRIARSMRDGDMAATIRAGLPRPLRVALVLGACSVIGSLAAARLAIALPPAVVKLYIALLIVGMGVLVLATRRKERAFSWRRIAGLGVLASFNKGMSGGGYGPIVTAGQLTSGVDGRSAVAVTSVSEALSCLAGLVVYVGAGGLQALPLAAWAVVGGVLSVPLAAVAVRRISVTRFTVIIGVATLGLGLFNLASLALQQ